MKKTEISDNSKSDMLKIYDEIISCIVGDTNNAGFCGIDISRQFQPGERNHLSVPKSINAAFLIGLSGEKHDRYCDAMDYLKEMEVDPVWAEVVSFYRKGLSFLPAEFHESNGDKIETTLMKLQDHLQKGDRDELQELIWSLFNPEARGIVQDKESRTESLRKKRTVKIDTLNPKPIADVAKEVLFTSNALITIPSPHIAIDDLDLEGELKEALDLILKEDQMFWYDHPVQIGVEPEKNEIIYGLKHLSEALQYEKKKGTLSGDEALTCILSASVTHEGLQGIAKDYIAAEIKKEHNLPGLNVHLFTEADSWKLIHEVLIPAAKKYLTATEDATVLLKEIVGVDGMYGRHYSFLKAIAAFWQVLINPEIRATFKIDLDQVFPQENLVEETGETAFQHLMSPLWGAEGTDYDGNPVSLGLIAGALVNEKDISPSIFTPDVTYPSPPLKGEDTLFCSRIPQALSTAAEMMTRYDSVDIDGRKHCIQRIHVTGGTNGILLNSLRKYRPFTPTFVARAEDQAYLLSVLFSNTNEPSLRYVHKDGFIMRHDKEAFAGEAIKAAAIGKTVGDYERLLVFSHYAKALSWDTKKIKDSIDPFTGSFVSHLPLNVVYLRLALKAATFFDSQNEEDGYKGLELINIGSKKLSFTIEEVSEKGGLKEIFEREKRAWGLYYDILDQLEAALKEGDTFALELREKAMEIVKNTTIDLSE